jgi:hypothetical protein
MRQRPFLLLLAALFLVVFGAGDASAIDEKEPKRTYPVDSYVSSLDISADGKYIVAGTCLGEWGNTGQSAAVTLFKNGIIPTSDYDFRYGLPESFACPATDMSDNGVYVMYTSASGHLSLNVVYAEKAGTSDGIHSLDTVSDSGYVCRVGISADGNRVIAVECRTGPDGDKRSEIRSYTEGSNGWYSDMSYTIDGFVRHLSISANGRYAIVGTGSGDGTNGLHLFDLDSNENHLVWTYGAGTTADGVDISRNGDYIVANIRDNSTEITTLFYEQTALWSLNESQGSSSQVQISDDGNYILIGNRLFSKDSPTPIRSFADEEASVLLSSNGENILARGSDGNLSFFDRDSSSPLWIIKQDRVYHFAISSDGKHVAIVTKLGDDYYVYYYVEGFNFTLAGAGILIFIVAGVVISRRKQTTTL